MMEMVRISKSDQVLDAECGAGRAAIFMSTTIDAKAIGITISENQVDFSRQQSKNRKLDYIHTSSADDSFDVVWVCESISSVPNK